MSSGPARYELFALRKPAILKNLQYAITVDVFTTLCVGFQNGEDDVLFTGTADVLNSHIAGDFQQFGD